MSGTKKEELKKIGLLFVVAFDLGKQVDAEEIKAKLLGSDLAWWKNIDERRNYIDKFGNQTDEKSTAEYQ